MNMIFLEHVVYTFQTTNGLETKDENPVAMVVRTIQSTQECYSFGLFGTCIITPGTLWIAIVRGTRKWVNMIFLEHVASVTKGKNDSFSLNHCDEEV